MWFMEKNCLLDGYQCGFQTGHTTLDHLVHLETKICQAFMNNQCCLPVFFDIEKPYDTARRYGILQDLLILGIDGHMPSIIQSCLERHSFHIKVGILLSCALFKKMVYSKEGI